MPRSMHRNDSSGDITYEQAYGLCLLSVVIAVIGLGMMVLILL